MAEVNTQTEDLKRFRELIEAASSNVQYGLISARSVDEHADDFRESLSKGKIGPDGKVDLWGVYLKDTSIPVCHTGNGPTSEANARLIEFLFNSAPFIFDELERLYAMAEAHETNLQRLERLAKGNGSRRGTAVSDVTSNLVTHWTGSQIPMTSCGTCAHSYPNDSAVGVRLGCWRNHVPFDSFTLPHRLDCGGRDWKGKL